MFSPGYYPTIQQPLTIVNCVATSCIHMFSLSLILYSYVFTFIDTGPFTVAAIGAPVRLAWIVPTMLIFYPHIASNQRHDVTHIGRVAGYIMTLSTKQRMAL